MNIFERLDKKRGKGLIPTEDVVYADQISGFKSFYRKIEKQIFQLFELRSGFSYSDRNTWRFAFERTAERAEEHDFLKYIFAGGESAEAAQQAFDP